MGTINYGTSEFLTIGLLTMDFDEAKTSLIECYEDLPDPSDDEVYTYIYDIAGEDRLTVEQEFNKLSFSVFDVKVEPGWCTSYKDYDTTLASIDRAYNDMLEAIKKAPVEEV